MPFSNAASWPTASYACVAPTVPMKSSWPSVASGAASVRAVAPGAWWRPPLTWSITLSRGCQYDNGCSRFRSRCACCSRPIRSYSRRCCRSSTGSFPDFLSIKQAGLKQNQAKTGAVTLIQRFGSAANLNIHLHCLVLDGVYRTTEGLPVFHAVRAPTAEELQVLLTRIIKRLMNRMHRDVQL